MDSTKEHKSYSILSYCYGYGGLDKGIERILPSRIAAYVEIEAFQDFNLVAAMESGLVDKAPIWTDAKTFDPLPFRHRVHGIIGGYPCQGESLAGKRKLWEDERFLWPYLERAVSTIRPLFCFFENVGGHLTGSFPYVLDSLRSMGYAVEAGLFTASEVGAPHKRERLFILAIDKNADNREIELLLAYSTGRNGSIKQKSRKNKIATAESGKSELGYSKHNGRSATKESRSFGEAISYTEKRAYCSSKSKGTSSPRELANNKSILLQGQQSRQRQEQFRGSSEQLADTSSQRNGESSEEHETRQLEQESNQWPARPGQAQYEWEEPRTSQPGVGCTVNGYNFRTELLRQYGNGVVSETAEKAMIYLIEKLIDDILQIE